MQVAYIGLSPLKEGYNRRKEDMRKWLENLGERNMRVVREKNPKEKEILFKFHKVGSFSQYRFGQKRITRKIAKNLRSSPSKTCVTIFGASHCWIFLTLNTSKLGA